MVISQKAFTLLLRVASGRLGAAPPPPDGTPPETREFFAHISAQLIGYCKMTFADRASAHAPVIPGNARPARSGGLNSSGMAESI